MLITIQNRSNHLYKNVHTYVCILVTRCGAPHMYDFRRDASRTCIPHAVAAHVYARHLPVRVPHIIIFYGFRYVSYVTPCTKTPLHESAPCTRTGIAVFEIELFRQNITISKTHFCARVLVSNVGHTPKIPTLPSS